MDNKSPEAFRTISEVAEWLGVPTHVLRFWESRFGQVKPVKRAGGRRYYRPSDMELLGGIRKLLHDDGMTIRGVQKLLRDKGVKHVAALSPPIDQPADMQLVDTSGEMFEPGDAMPVGPTGELPDFADSIEDAELLEDTGPDTVADAMPDPAEIVAATEEIVAEAAEQVAPVPPAGAMAPGPVVEAPPRDEAGAMPETEPETADRAFPGPTEMDFLAHEAIPETHEGGPAAADTSPTDLSAAPADRPVADAAPPETGPLLVWEEVSDEIADMGASGAAGAVPGPAQTEAPASGDDHSGAFPLGPETRIAGTPEPDPDREIGAAPGAAVGLPGAETADEAGMRPAETDPVALARALVMGGTAAEEPAASGPAGGAAPTPPLPEIGPDPDDDAPFDLPLALSVRLRRHHATRGGIGLGPAALRAYADRLGALSDRLGRDPDRRRPF